MGRWLTLLRWLGPWASESVAPRGPRRHAVEIPAETGGPPLSAWLYQPRRRVRGAYLIAPGIHFDGPADPRMDRFCRILAAAGNLVLAPFLPDYLQLRVRAGVVDDLDRAFTEIAERARPHGIRPGIFSISFGSLPALRVAARRGTAVGRLVVFGGYADWRETIGFCIDGRAGPPAPVGHDPLNLPVVCLNLLDQWRPPPSNPRAIAEAWRRFARATWSRAGRPALKEPDAYQPIARQIAAGMPEEARELFLQGCRVEPGGEAGARAALERMDPAPLDPRPQLADVRCPVTLVHGLDDEVIPPSQLAALAAAFPEVCDVTAHLTGLYGHTAAAGPAAGSWAGPVLRLPKLLVELWTMLRILRALAAGGAAPLRGPS